MRERTFLATGVEAVLALETEVADTMELIELAEAESDAAMVADALKSLRLVAAEAHRREIESLLGAAGMASVGGGGGGAAKRRVPRRRPKGRASRQADLCKLEGADRGRCCPQAVRLRPWSLEGAAAALEGASGLEAPGVALCGGDLNGRRRKNLCDDACTEGFFYLEGQRHIDSPPTLPFCGLYRRSGGQARPRRPSGLDGRSGVAGALAADR